MTVKDVEARLQAMPTAEKAAMRAAVEKQIEEFDRFFEELGNGSMSRTEAALLRTYLTAAATGLLPSARPTP